MADYPDIYADGFSVTAGPMGVTLTMTLSNPNTQPGRQQNMPVNPVVRLRMSPALADDLSKVLATSMAQAKTMNAQQTGESTKH
jgi:hypothetical protein